MDSRRIHVRSFNQNGHIYEDGVRIGSGPLNTVTGDIITAAQMNRHSEEMVRYFDDVERVCAGMTPFPTEPAPVSVSALGLMAAVAVAAGASQQKVSRRDLFFGFLRRSK